MFLMYIWAFFHHSFEMLNDEDMANGIAGVGPMPRAEPKTLDSACGRNPSPLVTDTCQKIDPSVSLLGALIRRHTISSSIVRPRMAGDR
jgi:hypothetical protein